jgi:predicted nucleotidyltransferase
LKGLQAGDLLQVAIFGLVARRKAGRDSNPDLMVDIRRNVGTLDVMVIGEFLTENQGVRFRHHKVWVRQGTAR